MLSNSPTSHERSTASLAARVVFLTDVPTPYVNEILRALASKVDLTCLFCSDTSTRGMPWQFSQQLGFRYFVVGGKVIRRGDTSGIDYYVSPKIFRHLVRARPGVIISGMYSFPTLYSWLYTQLFGAKLLIYSDGTAHTERNLSWLQRAARRFLLRRVTGCIAQSRPAAERFKQLDPVGPVFMAPHTTNLTPFINVASAREWAEPAELRLLTVGRLIESKGIHHLIRALAGLPPTRRPVRLTIVGSGPEENELKELVKRLKLERVRFAGFVDQAELPAYYAESDVFVFPTLDDTFGLVLLEAAASGLALIASNKAGGTQDFIEDNKVGFVFDPRDEGALARQIAILADDHDMVVRMGQAAHNVVRERTPDRTAEGYLSAIQAALAARR